MLKEQTSNRTFTYITGEPNETWRIGAVSLPNYAVVIDTGMYPFFATKIRKDLESTTGTPVTKLILTHYHGDHVFGNQAFKDCQIISSRALKDIMDEMATSNWTREQLEESAKQRPETYQKIDLDSLEITFPTEVFDTSFTVKDNGIEIVCKHVGGHTRDHSYVYIPTERVLFAGDLIFAKTFPWGGDPTVDPDDWITVLKEFQQMDIEKIIPGHGPVCDLNEVQVYLDFFEPVVNTMNELIIEGRTQEEVIEFGEYPDFYPASTPERRRDSLAQWYHVYKNKLGK